MEITDNIKTLANALAEIEILRKQLEDIPEGCTVADAKKLREANHALAFENFELKKKLEAAPEGCVLVPVEATQDLWRHFIAYDGASYSNPMDFNDFKQDWERMISAAPKPEGK
jgi:hypothetical protein